ncbi:hypothetical protein [Spirosoma sp.]|uniref:hypothetical protein n=1 Tax=Spirosoma sp. TaxID=1899569 RepID=UPI00261F5263|nr:hypothetical protein [Spirosoma sp.]MCX6215469.1 hypothetical protein [Spirosoma sp.]
MSFPTRGVSLWQKTKYVHSLGGWIIIILAGVLFFLSMSSVALGLTRLISRDLNGIWFLLGGVLLQGAAIWSVWVVEKRAHSCHSRS